jgi:hypothetical protein
VKMIDGSLRTVGNRGTVLSGWHQAGSTSAEPEPTTRQSPQNAPEQGFFGELARFAGGGHDFTTRIVGGQTYVCGAYYQESAHRAFHLLGGPGGSGSIAVAAIKFWTTSNPQTLFDGWDGLFYVTGGHIGNQAMQPKPDGSCPFCNLTVLHKAGKARIVYTTTLAWAYPITFTLGSEAQLTLLGNMETDNKEVHRHIADVQHAESVPSVIEGLDLFRRLGRVDLEVNYPELGVRDNCGTAGR